MPETPLTPGEINVLRALAAGHTQGQIARRLGVTPHAVSMRIRRAAVKLGTTGAVQTVLLADRRGLLRGAA